MREGGEKKGGEVREGREEKEGERWRGEEGGEKKEGEGGRRAREGWRDREINQSLAILSTYYVELLQTNSCATLGAQFTSSTSV